MLSSIQGLFGKNDSPAEAESANISVRSPDDVKDLEKQISIGPVTFILVHADWCGPCQMYKPTWKEFENIPGRTANMAMVHHDMVEHSPLLKNAKIPGYPTVLKVFPNGTIEKYKGNTNAMPNIRDKSTMTQELTSTPLNVRNSVNNQHMNSLNVRNSLNARSRVGMSNSQLAPDTAPGTAFAASLNTRRNLNNTRVSVHNMLEPGKGLTIGATDAPRIKIPVMTGGLRSRSSNSRSSSPMKGGSLYAALTQALMQAGPAVLLLGATQLLPPKKGTGSNARLTRKAAKGGRRRKTRSGR